MQEQRQSSDCLSRAPWGQRPDPPWPLHPVLARTARACRPQAACKTINYLKQHKHWQGSGIHQGLPIRRLGKILAKFCIQCFSRIMYMAHTLVVWHLYSSGLIHWQWGYAGVSETSTGEYTETEMSSFWWHFHHWLHWKLSFWQLPVKLVMKILSKWQHFISVYGTITSIYHRL